MLVDGFKAKGTVGLVLTDQYGNLKEERQYNNYITDTGKAYIAVNMHEFSYTTTAVSGTTLTLASHGLNNGDEVIFTSLGGNSGLLVNTLYFVVSSAASTFSVSATDGGAAISITGTANMTYRAKPNHMTMMALGTGSTDPSLGSRTTLVTEVGVRKAVTATRFTTTLANDTTQYVATFAAGVSTGAINEAGIFNAGTDGSAGGGGVMLCRTVFGGGSTGVINKLATDSLTVTWRIQIQ